MNIIIDILSNKVLGVNLPLNTSRKSIKVPDDFKLDKHHQELDDLKPYVHKLDEYNLPLYKDNVVSESIFDEVHYLNGSKPVKFEEKEVIVKWEDEDGTEHFETTTSQVPIEFITLEPVMIENYIDSIVSVIDFPHLFTLSEVLAKKYTDLLHTSQKDFVLADIFLNEDDVDFTNPKHTANTGKMILELLPLGEAQTKPISLIAPSKSFSVLDLEVMDGVEMYINGVKFTNEEATLQEEVDSCVIKFVNTTDKPKLVTSYAIGY